MGRLIELREKLSRWWLKRYNKVIKWFKCWIGLIRCEVILIWLVRCYLCRKSLPTIVNKMSQLTIYLVLWYYVRVIPTSISIIILRIMKPWYTIIPSITTTWYTLRRKLHRLKFLWKISSMDWFIVNAILHLSYLIYKVEWYCRFWLTRKCIWYHRSFLSKICIWCDSHFSKISCGKNDIWILLLSNMFSWLTLKYRYR